MYVRYDQAFKARHDVRDVVDPIFLKDIDNCNEWLVGETCVNSSEAREELVYDDDDLT